MLVLLAEEQSCFRLGGGRPVLGGEESPWFFALPQDDRMRTPLLKLKLAVCSVMPEQIAKYNMECMAKVAK